MTPKNAAARDGGRYAHALALILVAGAVDSIGFLHTSHFYVSFMSGNTTNLGIAASTLKWRAILAGAGVICCFVTGVVAGDLLTGVPPRRGRVTLLFEAVLLGAAAGKLIPSTLPLAFAMGMHNSLVLRAERIGIALTYVTGTLVHLGRAIAAFVARRPERHAGWPYFLLWVSLTGGALLGAAGSTHLGEPAALTVVAAALIALAAVIPSAGG